MACRGVYFAITMKEAERLRTAADDDEVRSIVQDEIEEAWDEAHLCETDKAWDAISRCLTDGKLRLGEARSTLALCVLGGEQLHDNEDYIVSLVMPHQVKDVAAALQPLTREWFRERYFAIDPKDYWVALDDQDFEYTWSWFERVREFYRKAAHENRAVIFTVDQ